MKPQLTRIISAVVDTQNLTLYKENGETIVLMQGDPRIRKILAEATPKLLDQGYADVDLVQENAYQKFEEQSTDVKLFRVAKEKLKSLFSMFSCSTPEPRVNEEGPQHTKAVIQHTKEAVEEILQHAVPVATPSFTEDSVTPQNNIVEEGGHTPGKHTESTGSDTIVAVVDGKVIPGMERIKTQFIRAVQANSVGMENFLKRLSTVIEKRSHSVEDLLKFLERGDLPIADDGSILIYKVLRRSGTRTDNTYVDCHTRKVEQWVGAYVCMDESLVDPNRKNECSNGLHVARRGYVSGFSGDVCVLAKLAPEDVIAVPAYDANKMRVCGYHIIMELSDAHYALLRSNKPITENEAGKILLANAMSGNHIHKTHKVRITAQMGNNVVVEELPIPSAKAEEVTLYKTEAPTEPPVVEALDNIEKGIQDAPVNLKEVIATVAQLTKKQQAQKLYDEGKHDELFALKKASKVSWEKLGLPQMESTVQVSKPVEEIKVAPRGKLTKLAPASKTPVIKFKEEPTPTPSVFVEAVPKTDPKREVNGVVLGEGSYKERIQKLVSIGITSTGVAAAVLDLKKKSKKSWDYLGVKPDVALQIMKLTT